MQAFGISAKQEKSAQEAKTSKRESRKIEQENEKHNERRKKSCDWVSSMQESRMQDGMAASNPSSTLNPWVRIVVILH